MRYGIFVSLFLVLVFASCKKDDDNGLIEVPPSLLSDVAPEDDEAIKAFLNTHFYNYEDFVNEPDVAHEIIIDTIAGDNADKKSLMEDAVAVTINVSSSHFGLSAGEEDIPHIYYYIQVREGKGGSPTVADSTFVKYQGSLLDGTLFDENQNFTWFELPLTRRGFGDGMSKLFAGTSDQIVENGDGTFTISDSGMGIIIMPSGLGYFNSSQTLIPAYSPLLFKVELGLYVENTDSDNDGVPSIEEDLNGNGYLFDDNTDGDDETFTFLPDFRDADDDGDGVSTRSEITDDNGNIIFPYPDADGDGVPDYLDPDTN